MLPAERDATPGDCWEAEAQTVSLSEAWEVENDGDEFGTPV